MQPAILLIPILTYGCAAIHYHLTDLKVKRTEDFGEKINIMRNFRKQGAIVVYTVPMLCAIIGILEIWYRG